MAIKNVGSFPCLCSSSSSALAMVDSPLPDKPVNQIQRGVWCFWAALVALFNSSTCLCTVIGSTEMDSILQISCQCSHHSRTSTTCGTKPIHARSVQETNRINKLKLRRIVECAISYYFVGNRPTRRLKAWHCYACLSQHSQLVNYYLG